MESLAVSFRTLCVRSTIATKPLVITILSYISRLCASLHLATLRYIILSIAIRLLFNIFTFFYIKAIRKGNSLYKEVIDIKKVLLALTLAVIYLNYAGSASAEIVKTSGEVEVKGNAAKSFICKALDPWIGTDTTNFYHQEYKARQVMIEHPKMEDIRVWIKEVQTTPNSQRFTHIVRVHLPYASVVIDEKKKMKVADNLMYGINMDYFTNYHNPDLVEKSVKLFDYNHKVISK